MITIDGPSGAGTSAVSRAVGSMLGWSVFGAGDHLRALAYLAIREGLFIGGILNVGGCLKLIEKIDSKKGILLFPNSKGGFLLDGVDVTQRLHTAEVTLSVQEVAAVPQIRAWHDKVMRDYSRAHRGRVVFEGRLTGFVFPEAELHVWLTADPPVADARVASARGEEVAALSRERDENDRTRDVAPVRQVDDAIVIDTTTIDEVKVAELIIATATLAKSLV